MTPEPPDMSIPDIEPEWLTQDIVLFPGILPWGRYLLDLAETVPDDRWFKQRQDALYPGPCEIRIELSFAARFGHAENGITKIVEHIVDVYCRNNVFGRFKGDGGYHLLKYKEGEAYDAHCDQLGGPQNPLKLLTVMIYPNDDYEGGDLYFPRHDIKVKPKAGDAYVFPSGFAFPHGTEPVTSGTRYCIVAWVH